MKIQVPIYHTTFLGYEEREYLVKCPNCGSLEMASFGERVKCIKCGYMTDLYEALKQAEKEEKWLQR